MSRLVTAVLGLFAGGTVGFVCGVAAAQCVAEAESHHRPTDVGSVTDLGGRNRRKPCGGPTCMPGGCE